MIIILINCTICKAGDNVIDKYYEYLCCLQLQLEISFLYTYEERQKEIILGILWLLWDVDSKNCVAMARLSRERVRFFLWARTVRAEIDSLSDNNLCASFFLVVVAAPFTHKIYIWSDLTIPVFAFVAIRKRKSVHTVLIGEKRR